jgi:hypothetical protein
MFQIKLVEQIKTHVFSVTFPENCTVSEIILKKCAAEQGTDNSIIRFMRFACSITKATNANSECVILLLFHGTNGYTNAPVRYIILTLPVLLVTPGIY